MKPGGRWTRWSVVLVLVSCQVVSASISIFSQHVTDNQFMTRAHSPYHIREMIEVEKSGSLNIESGVVINFYPGAGILVRGALIAKVYILRSETFLVYIEPLS